MSKVFLLSLNSLVSWLLKLIMLIVAMYFFLTENVLFGAFSILMLIISLIPAFINRSYDTNLPWSMDFFLTLWVTLSVLGELRLYKTIWWWDDFLHFGGTAVLAYLAFVLVYALNFVEKIRLSIPMIGFFTFLIGIAFGGIWEILEFWAWKFLDADLTMIGDPPNYEVAYRDTLFDLQLDSLGSILVAFAGMLYVGNQRHVKLREWMQPFIKIFGKKIRAVKDKTKEKIIEEKDKLREKFSKKDT